MTNEHETAPDNPPKPSTPIDLASNSLRRARHPLYAQAELEDIAAQLSATMIAENIQSPADSAVLLAAQAQVLDTIFHHFLMRGFNAPGGAPDTEDVRLALLAQRQSALTVDKLKRHEARMKKFQNSANRTEGHRK